MFLYYTTICEIIYRSDRPPTCSYSLFNTIFCTDLFWILKMLLLHILSNYLHIYIYGIVSVDWPAYFTMLQYLYDFIEAVITRQTSPEEAYRKLDEMASKQTELLRKLTKQVQESRMNHDDEAVKRAVNDYDDALERWEE